MGGEGAKNILKGWSGYKAQSHLTKIIFEAHKTTAYWFVRHRKEFSKEYHEGPRDQREVLNLDRSEYTCMACPWCGKGKEDHMHVLAHCTGEGRVGIRKKMVAQVERLLAEEWPVMGKWGGARVQGMPVESMQHPRVALLLPALVGAKGNCMVLRASEGDINKLNTINQ